MHYRWRTRRGTRSLERDWEALQTLVFSYEVNRFSNNVGIGLDQVPTGARSFQLTQTLLGGKLSAGYQVAPQVSIMLQYARGPDDRLAIPAGSENDETIKEESRKFYSVIVNREFPIGMRRSIDAKAGITFSDFQYRNQEGPAQWTVSRSIAIKPLVALGLRHEFSARWSGVAEVTNYFLSEPGTVTTVAVGIRYDL